VKTVAPTVLLLVDEYHFLLAKNKTNILLKDFGPNTYYLIKEPFKKAFHAGTKEDCFVSTLCLFRIQKYIDEAIAAVGEDQRQDCPMAKGKMGQIHVEEWHRRHEEPQKLFPR
jgi:hypothetical protein